MSKQARQYDSWIVLRDLLEKEGVARQHLNSYNEFISKGLQSIIDEIGEVEIETVSTPYKVKFGKVELGRPRVIEIDGSVSNVFPMEARLRNLSYASPIFLDMTIEEEGMSREATRQQIGDLPVMVRSDLCQLSKMTKEQLIAASEDPNDQGGYFIINGSERVIVGLEDLSPNKILVDVEKTGGRHHLQGPRLFFGRRLSLQARGNAQAGRCDQRQDTQLPGRPALRNRHASPGHKVRQGHRQRRLSQAGDSGSARGLLRQGERGTHRQGRTRLHRQQGRPRHARRVQNQEGPVYARLGIPAAPRARRTTGATTRRCSWGRRSASSWSCRLGWIEPDDKDHYGNKVIKFAGQMLADLFRTSFRNLVRDMKYQLERAGRRGEATSWAQPSGPGSSRTSSTTPSRPETGGGARSVSRSSWTGPTISAR